MSAMFLLLIVVIFIVVIRNTSLNELGPQIFFEAQFEHIHSSKNVY